MTARHRRTVLSLTFVTFTLAVALCLTSLYHLGVANAGSGSSVASEPAATVVSPGDPLGDPLGVYDRVVDLWRSGAIMPALILAAFGVCFILRAKFAWFREGHRAVYVSAAIGGLGMLVEACAGGATPNASMIVGAIVGSVMLAVNPKHPEPGE